MTGRFRNSKFEIRKIPFLGRDRQRCHQTGGRSRKIAMVVTYSEIHARYASKALSFGVAVPSPEAHRKLLREWYDGVLSNEQLSHIVSEFNDVAADAVPMITGNVSAGQYSVHTSPACLGHATCACTSVSSSSS